MQFEDQKQDTLLQRLSETFYKPTDTDIKDLLNLIQKTQGQVIVKIIKNTKIYEKISTYICEKLTQLDKKFYSAFFTLIKSSVKWEDQQSNLLLIGVIPKIISVHCLLNQQDKNEERIQMVEVIMYALYTEYLDKVNSILESRESEDQLYQISLFPKLEEELQIDQKQKNPRLQLFGKITQINQYNIKKIYEFMIELFYSRMIEFTKMIIEDFVQTCFILNGAKIQLENINQPIDYEKCQYSIFAIQLTEKCLETLIISTQTIGHYFKQIKDTRFLIEQLLKKTANESRYHAAGLAQSAKEIMYNTYDGIF